MKPTYDHLIKTLEEAYFQFAHNGDESDSDKEVLDAIEAAIKAAKE